MKCSENLIELKNWLEKQIAEEITAHDDYTKAANKTKELPKPWEEIVNQIASDEQDHASLLALLVHTISEKCGDGEVEPPKGKGMIEKGVELAKAAAPYVPLVIAAIPK